MTWGGPNPSGDGPVYPDDQQRAEASSPRVEGAGTATGPTMAGAPTGDDGAGPDSGWVPPDRRDWRHPSEVAATATVERGEPEIPPQLGGPNGPDDPGGPSGGGGGGGGGGGDGQGGWGGPARRRRWSSWSTLLVGSGAAAVVVAGALLLYTSVTGSHGANPTASPPTTELPEVTGAGNGDTAPAISDVSPTLVSLAPTTTDGSVSGASTSDGAASRFGVAIGGRGLVATTADGIVSGTRLTATTATGDVARATVVATDEASDVAVVRVDLPLRTARFADDGSLKPGARTVAVTMVPEATDRGSEIHLQPRWWWATVSEVGRPVSVGSAEGMASIAVTTPGDAVPADDVLVDTNGQVVGIRDLSAQVDESGAVTTSDILGTTAPSLPDQVFLPSDLVLGVAVDLAERGRVDHGWLGIHGQDYGPVPPSIPVPSTTSTGPAPTGSGVTGAQVTTVNADGPSAHRLRPGDVIVALDGQSVRSMAELRTRLYVLSPGITVTLSVIRDGVPTQVEVVLSDSPYHAGSG